MGGRGLCGREEFLWEEEASMGGRGLCGREGLL